MTDKDREPIEITLLDVVVAHTVTYTAERMTIELPAGSIKDGEVDSTAVDNYFAELDLDNCDELSADEEDTSVDEWEVDG